MIEIIKRSDIAELEKIAQNTREIMIDAASKNGGHLASSLGAVELTIALLKVFDLPDDKIIWDVGHQSYAYKILTDRSDRFHTMRTLNGISGFPKRCESPYDFFGTGHGGTSISAGLGLREALKIRNINSKVISVIGDGAMTSGLALEAMNNVDETGKNTITILNDNDMFISTSVGSLSRWFSRALSGQKYTSARSEIKQIIAKLPPFFHGEKIIELIRKTINSSKSLLTPGILFEGFGYQYVGPIDGHNIEELIETLEDIKPNSEPVLLHVHSVKGKGYEPAERNPRKFHGVGPFDKKTGETKPSLPSFTSYLSDYLPKLFKRHGNLVAITAAMPDGTGLNTLQNIYPHRVYDVGMSEGHAVTFAAGLAAGGSRPVVAIYSTFLQRAYDSIIHDVALQNLPVIFLIDRAGLVGDDGATHHGLFDMSYLRIIPNLTLMAPRDEHEMARMIEFAVNSVSGPVAIRYPRGSGSGKRHYNRLTPLKSVKGELLATGKDTMIVSVGIMADTASKAVEKLDKKGHKVFHYDLRFIKPIPEELFEIINKNNISKLVTIEDGIMAGGAGSAILEGLSARNMDVKCRIIGVNDSFSTHGTQNELKKLEGLTVENIVKAVTSLTK
ncbi:MAG TPA: 1-deoxy-D-xylulose-5-phosphate synthase [bacterium]|nr:1-deoxy-D-xylulose-5-phosphate synthase [bacterium]